MLLVVGLLALVGAGAAVAGKYGKRIGASRSSGDYAVTVASGNANHPHAIYVVVGSAPHQHVTGSWANVCSRGFGAGSKSGDFSGRTPLVRKLRFPMRRPSSCTASASAQLADSGRIKVALYKR